MAKAAKIDIELIRLIGGQWKNPSKMTSRGAKSILAAISAGTVPDIHSATLVSILQQVYEALNNNQPPVKISPTY